MPIDEIEVKGSSLSLQVWKARIDSTEALLRIIDDPDNEEEDRLFDPAKEKPGFHDLDANEKILRGFYSCVVPFETEHLVDGLTTKTLHKRIETTEFLALLDRVFTLGPATPTKPLAHQLSLLSGYGVAKMEFEFHQMGQFHDRLHQLNAISLANPKDKEIRRVRLSGKIESYTDYNVIDPRNHGIDSVKGLVDGPLGPMTVTLSRKGSLGIRIRRGFVMNVDCLEWLMKLIMADSVPPIQKMLGNE